MTHSVHADLHSHTSMSDGVLSPAELVQIAAERGLKVLAVTDHDTTEGVSEAVEAGQAAGVRVVPGVEVSTEDGAPVHILGLFVRPDAPWLFELRRHRQEERRSRIDRICERLREVGVDIDPDAVRTLAGSGSVGRPHMARALIEAGHARDVDDAFDRYLGIGQVAYLPTGKVSVSEAIAGIAESGGVSCLAHPGIYGLDDRIAGWATAGLAGIECVHPRHDTEAEARYRALCETLGLVVTGGSDFHGDGTIWTRPPGSCGLTADELAAVEALAQAGTA